MWFQFAPNEDSISVDRMAFVAEWSSKEGNFFRAPAHFKDKLVLEGGCKALGGAPEGVPDTLPDLVFAEKPQDNASDLLALKQQLSMEKSATSALRAELGATLHERDQLKLQVHELSEKILELETKIEDDEE